jgi:ABC-2 type transport system permease protein
MADLGPLDKAGLAETSAGPFSRLARTQYAALLTMRWRMFVIGLRSIRGILELGATGISLMVYGFMGLGLGVGLGAGAYSLVSGAEWQYLPVLFWVACLVWQTVPIAVASVQEQFELSGLLRFPVSFGSFFMLHVIFGLVDVSTILGGLCCIGIWIGTTIAKPELFAWMALGLAGFAAFNILLGRAILAWLERWLAQRKTREILGAAFMVLVLGMQLLNPALREHSRQGRMSGQGRAESQRMPAREMGLWLKAASVAQEWLPPGRAAVAQRQAAEQHPVAALGSLGLLGLYVLAAGAVLAVRLRAEYRGENLGEAPLRKKAEQRETKWLLDGSGPIAAVMEKELRTVLRSMPLLYALGAPLLMMFVFGSLFRSSARGGSPFTMAFPLCLAYAMLGFTRVLSNNLGTEGAGIQVLFLSPTPIRTVLLAKNIFHAILFGLVATLAGVLAILRLGRPGNAVLASSVALLLFALPLQLAAGNVFSITMPYRVNPGRITRQGGSSASALLSLLVQLAVLAIGAAVFGICMMEGRLWLAVPILLALSGVAVYAWMRVLRNADTMANQNRDSLIATLAKVE